MLALILPKAGETATIVGPGEWRVESDRLTVVGDRSIGFDLRAVGVDVPPEEVRLGPRRIAFDLPGEGDEGLIVVPSRDMLPADLAGCGKSSCRGAAHSDHQNRGSGQTSGSPRLVFFRVDQDKEDDQEQHRNPDGGDQQERSPSGKCSIGDELKPDIEPAPPSSQVLPRPSPGGGTATLSLGRGLG